LQEMVTGLHNYSHMHTCTPFTRTHEQAENSTQKQLDLIKINDNTKRNLEQEIQGYKMEAQKQSKLIFQLEKEREKYAVEASEAASKYMQVRSVGVVQGGGISRHGECARASV